MGIAAVRADRTNGRMIRDQAVPGEMIDDLLLHLGFADDAVTANPIGNEGKSDIISAARVSGGLLVHLPLFFVPASFEKLDKVRKA